eukprot:Gregarina_sp_Pseudo_9__3525@NODE_3690_length_583_cov_21_691176_g3377_i0_p1_GENE_NODE_3690_length_583_cov_21_691176_g3377_i0NODE_3690_length_583_cov_21_691176_g3377_i0_p1_ORF_typecomplete_len162_score33_12HetR_C/PF18460_1/0_13_NODE_3690_length_583_cov_21_691176_g3377_i042488
MQFVGVLSFFVSLVVLGRAEYELPDLCRGITEQPAWASLTPLREPDTKLLLKATVLEDSVLRVAMRWPAVFADVVYDTERCYRGVLRVLQVLNVVTHETSEAAEDIASVLRHMKSLEHRNWETDELLLWTANPHSHALQFRPAFVPQD